MNDSSDIVPLVLAAGQGKRMQSSLPKVMHFVCDKPMLEHVLDLCRKISTRPAAVLINAEQTSIRQYLEENFPHVAICVQKKPRGTADAVASFAALFKNALKPSYVDSELVSGSEQNAAFALILYGDVPGINIETLNRFIAFSQEKNSDVALIGMMAKNPTGYGRIFLGEDGNIRKIIEERDCTDVERKIQLCNTGVFLVRVKVLFEILSEILPNNAQNEYYLTDCVPIALKKNLKVDVFETFGYEEFLGVNDPEQLKQVEAIMRKNICVES